MFIFNCRPEDNARWRAQQQARQEEARAAEAALAASLQAPEEPSAARAAASDERRKARRRRGHSLQSLERPLSPSTHLRKLHDVAHAHLVTKPCKEHHRECYYPRNRLGLTLPYGELPEGVVRPPPPGDRFIPPPTKGAKRWGPLTSDYGKAGNDVDRMWLLRDIQRHNSEPLISTTADLGRQEPRINPSADSPGVSTCLVGGTTIALRKTSRVPDQKKRSDTRQLGLYEASFPDWRNYKAPEYGLGQTDVTSFAGELVLQKILMRK